MDRVSAVRVRRQEPLSNWTRFGLGGPCEALLSTESEDAYVKLQGLLTELPVRWTAIGGGTNLIVHEAGYRGLVVKFDGDSLKASGNTIWAQAGAELNHLVDFANSQGLAGMESLAGIPGWVGAAVYGNAGAYGQTISDHLVRVRWVKNGQLGEWSKAECGFVYRGSHFKADKGMQILSVEFSLPKGEAAVLAAKSKEIRAMRDAKFPPTMQCAGSIFKNLKLAELPAQAQEAVPPTLPREGKVPAAWFLEQVGAKGMTQGGIQVAGYHANLLFNAGNGTPPQFRALVQELKRRVEAKFGFLLEEEIQYLGGEPEFPLLAELRRTSTVLATCQQWITDQESLHSFAQAEEQLSRKAAKALFAKLPRTAKQEPATREALLAGLALVPSRFWGDGEGSLTALITKTLDRDLGQAAKLVAKRRKSGWK